MSSDSEDCLVCAVFPMLNLANYLGLSFIIGTCKHRNKETLQTKFVSSSWLLGFSVGILVILIYSSAVLIRELVLEYDEQNIAIFANLLYTCNGIIMMLMYVSQFRLR